MNESTRYETDQPIGVDQPGVYRIKIQGRLSAGTRQLFDEMAVSEERSAGGSPITTLTGQITDQAALHGIIARIRDLGLPLILVAFVGHE